MRALAEGHGAGMAHGQPKIESGHYGLARSESSMTPRGIRSGTRLGFNLTEPFSSLARAALLRFPHSHCDSLFQQSPPAGGVGTAVQGHGPRHTLRSSVALSLSFGLESCWCGLRLELQ
jgi:hypothetical protein